MISSETMLCFASLIAGTSIVIVMNEQESCQMQVFTSVWTQSDVFMHALAFLKGVTFDCENEALWALGLCRFCASTSGIRVPLFSGLGSEGGARLKQQALNEMSCWIYASLHLATLRATLLSRALIGRSDDAWDCLRGQRSALCHH